MHAEIQTAFKNFIQLRDRRYANLHLYADEVEFMSFAAKLCPISCSQLLQDIWVLYELNSKRNGYFVEFGACDGVIHSNTLLLEKTYGWDGALAEPARTWQQALRANRDCYISNNCVYMKDGEQILFRETEVRELSTIEKFTQSDYNAAARDSADQYVVETLSLTSFLQNARAPKEIDYMSIDVEGAELDVLRTFDFGAYDIKILTIEHNFGGQRDAIANLLESRGYRRKFTMLSMFDDWYVRPDLINRERK